MGPEDAAEWAEKRTICNMRFDLGTVLEFTSKRH